MKDNINDENKRLKLISRKLDEALGNAQHELAREMEENKRLGDRLIATKDEVQSKFRYSVGLVNKIDAALGLLSVMRCECKPPKGPMCDRHLIEQALKGEK